MFGIGFPLSIHWRGENLSKSYEQFQLLITYSQKFMLIKELF